MIESIAYPIAAVINGILFCCCIFGIIKCHQRCNRRQQEIIVEQANTYYPPPTQTIVYIPTNNQPFLQNQYNAPLPSAPPAIIYEDQFF